MRLIPLILALLVFNIGISQTKLTGVAVEVQYQLDAKQYSVKEVMNFDTLMAGETLKLKSLILNGSKETEPFIASRNAQFKVKKISQDLAEFDLQVWRNTSDNLLEVTYLVEEASGTTDIPLYFTELPAASSNEGFFRFEMDVPEKQSYHFRFPSVTLEEAMMDNGYKKVSFSMPALPSMVRLSLLEEDAEAPMATAVIDIAVAATFIFIALLIWRYRKKLVYG